MLCVIIQEFPLPFSPTVRVAVCSFHQSPLLLILRCTGQVYCHFITALCDPGNNIYHIHITAIYHIHITAGYYKLA